MARTQSITMPQLRRMIQEESNFLQGKTHPADVTLDELPWEEAEDGGRQDFISQMDKPTPAVKAEQRLRSLKLTEAALMRKLRETRRRRLAVEGFIAESVGRRRPTRPTATRGRRPPTRRR